MMTGERRTALILRELPTREAFESALQSMGVQALAIDDSLLSSISDWTQFELIVADEDLARLLRPTLDGARSSESLSRAALVAVGSVSPSAVTQEFDAYVAIPSMVSEIPACLKGILHSYRELNKRYHSAVDELRLSRDRFASVTNGISIVDARQPDCPIVYVNSSFELMTGYSLQEIKGRNCRFLQGDARDQPGRILVQEALERGRGTVAILQNFRKDGTLFWNELRVHPVHDAKGEITHFVGIQTDVTSQVQRESALRDSEQLAAVGRLAASVFHEFANPLDSLMNLIYLSGKALAHVPEATVSREYLALAEEQLRRIGSITERNVQSARRSSKASASLMDQMVTTVSDTYGARLRRNLVNTVYRLRATQHLVVYEDEICHVIGSLVSNAIQAMKGYKSRRLYLRTRDAWNHRSDMAGVLLTVADEGVGIPIHMRQSIFEAFVSTQTQIGSGLGLWITAQTVQRHHGYIRCRSCTGKEQHGTVIQIFLPLQAATPATSKMHSAAMTRRSS